MATSNEIAVHPALDGAVTGVNGALAVHNESALRTSRVDALVRDAVFGTPEARDHARWVIWELAQSVGIHPSSIHELYMARGRAGPDRNPIHGFTVPAINVRGRAYDTARAIFRVVNRMDVGAFILEIARSEIGYTDQRPGEYVAVMLGAALREGFRGPLFIQGDHFQINAKKFAIDPATEADAVKALAREAIAAGFYNIDVDTSTLVDLSQPTLAEQQRRNYENCAGIWSVVRAAQPAGVTISVGGEIGEVGTRNSTVGELEAFMDGFNTAAAGLAPGQAGLSKISVQSGTSHGGVVLSDGSIADVKLDLHTLEELSEVARRRYGLAGAVQHGASTLPDSAFNNFPRTETAEIHLATNFQNMLYDAMPAELREEIYAWLRSNAADERKSTDSDEQFYYKTRKKALGPFKRKLWDMPEAAGELLAREYEAKFEFLFTQLAVGGTRDIVQGAVHPTVLHRPAPGSAGQVVHAAAPDDTELSD